MSIEIRGVTRKFGDFAALSNVSLTVPSGKLVALLGPSGSGKTTLLRIIAGLETCDTGSVLFNGEEATDRDVRDRRVGFVFQHYALFRHMTVFDNVAFGLSVRPRRDRPGKAAIRDRVRELLRLVQLESVGDRYPAQLSGGQRQRIALARALAVEPEVLLLDEPFGALDARVRKELRGWLRRLHDEMRITSVFVTHDQEEAFALADRVVVIHNGRIEQDAPAVTVWQAPANAFVAEFLGYNVTEAFGGLVAVRPDGLRLTPDGPVPVTVIDRTFRRDHFRVRVRTDAGEVLEVAVRPDRAGSSETPETGSRTSVWLVPDTAVPLAST
jgi:sulfate transport system ATP-binding protein